jgi:protein TonB
MQRRQHDANTGAFSAAGALSGNTVDVVVISADDALLTTLQQSAGPEHVLWHAPSAEAAVELLLGGHCGILIADMQVGRNDSAALFERLQTQFPELVMLATGRRDEEGAVAALISKGSVYRFLHKPVSPARANLFLATATRRYHEISQTGSSPALASVKQLAEPANRVPLIGGIAAAVLLAVALTVYFTRSDEPAAPGASPVAAAPAAATPTQPARSTAELLENARQAFDAGRLSAPANDNALDLYRSVLAIEADNATAQTGVQDVLDALELQVMQALQARNAPNAARALSVLQSADPTHSEIAPLRDQLLALSRSTRPEPVVAKPAEQRKASPTRTTPNTDLARTRLAKGQLIAPADDSALFHLRAARDANEDESANRILATDLGARLLAQARASIAISDAAQARQAYGAAVALDREFELALPELVEVGGELDDLSAASAQAASSRAVVELLAPVIRLRESGQLIRPVGNNAFDSLQQVASQYPNAAEVRAEQQRLAFTLIDNARTAFAARELEQAELLLGRADELVPRMSSTRSLLDQIAAAKEERAAAGRVLQAADLPRKRDVAPIYPPDAQRKGTEGWVDVEFTIAMDGTTQQLVVREAQPAGVFDKAAVDALRKWRFEPVIRNGAAVNQRAVLRMRFALD